MKILNHFFVCHLFVGITLISITSLADVFYQQNTDNSGVSSFTRANWTNNNTTAAVKASEGNDYVLFTDSIGMNCRTPATGDAAFIGNSLTISGGSGPDGEPYAKLFMKNDKNKTVSISNLILDGGAISIANGGSSFSCDILGNISISNGCKGIVWLNKTENDIRQSVISSDIHGSGTFALSLRPYVSQQSYGKVTFAGDNSDFTGPFAVENGGTIVFRTASSWFGNPAEPINGFAISSVATALMFEDDITTPTANRMMSIAGNTEIGVADEKTFAMAGAISGEGAIYKSGNGTIVLSGANSFSGGFTASNGTVQVGSASALGTGNVTFMGGTEIVIDADSLAASPLEISGSISGLTNITLKNSLYIPGKDIPLVLYPNGTSLGDIILDDITFNSDSPEFLTVTLGVDETDEGRILLKAIVPNTTEPIFVLTLISNEYTNAVAEYSISSHGGSATSTEFFADISTNSDFFVDQTVTTTLESVTAEESLPITKQASFTEITPGLTYYLRVRGINNQGAATTNLTSFISIMATAPQTTCTMTELTAGGNLSLTWSLDEIGIGNSIVSLWLEKSYDETFSNVIPISLGNSTAVTNGVHVESAPKPGEIWFCRIKAEGNSETVGYSAVTRVSLSGLTWWVDSLGSGAGISSNAPSSDLYSILALMQNDDTLNIRGGEDREYSLGGTNSIILSNNNISVCGWGETKPRFNVSKVVPSSKGIVILGASGVRISGLEFAVTNEIKSVSDCALFYAIDPNLNGSVDNATIENCDIKGVGKGSESSFNILRHNHTSDSAPHGTNFVMRGCFLADFPKSSHLLSSSGTKGYYGENTFTNCANIFGYRNNSSWSECSIVSNRIYNPVIQDKGGVITAAYGGLVNTKIAFNLVWNDGISCTNSFFFIKKASSAESILNDCNVYNNTTYGLDGFIGSINIRTTSTKVDPFIANNLVINAKIAPIYEQDDSIFRSIFSDKTQFRNNVISSEYQFDIFDSSYTNGCPFEANIISNSIIENVSFIDTTRTWRNDFMSPRGDITKEVCYGLGNVEGFEEYPDYVGAIHPTIGQATTILIIR